MIFNVTVLSEALGLVDFCSPKGAQRMLSMRGSTLLVLRVDLYFGRLREDNVLPHIETLEFVA